MKFVSVFSLFLALLLPAAIAAADTVKVPGDFETIQEAVNAASEGDTILVSKGSYAEKVTIRDKKDIVLRGKGKPVLDAESTGTALTITNCNGIEVRGFAILNGGTRAVYILNSDAVTISRCVVKDATGDGILAAGCHMLTVEKCRFEQTGRSGVELSTGTQNSVVVKNRFVRCALAGVTAEGDHNVIEKNKLTDTEIGIFIPGDSNDVIKNVMTDPVDAIWVDGSENRVQGNKVNAAEFWGIYLDSDASSNIVQDNTLSRPGELGMYVWSTGSRIESNRVTRAGDNGIELARDAMDNAFIANRASNSRNFDLKNGSPEDANTFKENKFKKTDG